MQNKQINISKNYEEKLKRKSRKLSIIEGSGYSIMNGFGLRFITPFAVALNVSNTVIGLLSSIPGVIGSLIQIPASRIIESSSRKKIVFTGVLLQALSWILLIGVGFLYYFIHTSILLTSLLLLIIYTLIISFGAFAGPAWNSLMKDIVSKDKATSYFGRRSRITGIVALISTFLAGFLLNYLKEIHFLLGFGVLFSIAFIGRLISALVFLKHYDPQRCPLPKDYYFSFWQFVKKMPKNNFGKYTIFSSLFIFASAIASPFFSVYMLKNLQFSYAAFTLVTLSSVLFTLLFMPFWGKLGDKYGNAKIMKLTGSLIFLVPLLWFVSSFISSTYSLSLIIYLLIIEAFTGFIWAGFNLSSATFIYDAVTKERIALCIAYTNIIGSIGVLIGAYLGGKLASFSSPILGLNPILFVFLVSAALRLLTGLLLILTIKEVRPAVKPLDISSPAYYLEKILAHSNILHNTRGIKNMP